VSPVPKRSKISDHPELVPRTRGQTLGDARAIQRFLEQKRTHRPGSADSRITAVGINEEGSAGKRLTEAGALDSGFFYKRNVRGSGSADSRTTAVGISEGGSAEKRLTEAVGLDSGSFYKRNVRQSGLADFRTTGVRIGEERSADKRLAGPDGVHGSSGSAHKTRTDTHGPGSADKSTDGREKIRGSELADLRTVNGGNSDTGPVVLNVESDEDQSDIIIVESNGRVNDVICLKPTRADGNKRRSTNEFEENTSKKTK
jgi:hypothetical protein